MVERIRVSENRRFLETESGQPFFWLGDTAWELFHRLNREEAEVYLENRRQRGFTVIQAVALAEFDGLRTPNAYGDLPLQDLDPTRLNEAYFSHIDAVIRCAAEKGLYIGLLPTWGDKVTAAWGLGPEVFNLENARVYGELLGRRYREDANVLWILGGDRSGEGLVELWSAMAAGIAAGLGRKPFITLHPNGGKGSSEWFHDQEWLDMNMWQSGHVPLDSPTWEMIASDYNRAPGKPVLDAEPNYEDHPIDPFTRKWKPEYGRFSDYNVRKQGYRSVFAGACGYTYGHHSVWQFLSPDHEPVNFPVFEWPEAILQPGAAQLIHLKNLMLSRPYFSRIPDQGMILSDAGEGSSRMIATRDALRRYAFVYVPLAEQTVEVDLGRLAGPVKAWWFDPRNGKVHDAGQFTHQARQVFTSPIAGPDWVLGFDVLE